MENKKFNFRQLILAREVRGLSQSALAESMTGLSQGALSKIERNEVEPTVDVVQRLSNQLKFPTTFFFQAGNKTTGTNDFFYRKRMDLSAKLKTKLEAEVELIRYIYDRLLESVDIPETRIPSAAIGNNFTPEDAAAMAREYYGIQSGPIKNLIKILERNGIAVIFIDAGTPKFDGLTTFTDKNHPIIIVNSKIPNDRKKHTICHELAHQILHLPFRFDYTLYEQLRDDEKTLDRQADRFAAAFLMPEREIRGSLNGLTYSKLTEHKIYWQVSKKSIIYRANYLKCITPEKYTQLLIELSRRGERITENIIVDLDEPQIFKQIFNYYREKLNYTNEDFNNLLCLSENDWIPLFGNNSKMKIVIN